MPSTHSMSSTLEREDFVVQVDGDVGGELFEEVLDGSHDAEGAADEDGDAGLAEGLCDVGRVAQQREEVWAAAGDVDAGQGDGLKVAGDAVGTDDGPLRHAGEEHVILNAVPPSAPRWVQRKFGIFVSRRFHGRV